MLNELMPSLTKDIRYAIRSLAKHRGFTMIAVLTIALGVGANTAIFSVVNGVLLNPLPFPESQQLISLNETSKEVPVMQVSYPNYLDWRAQQTTLENLAARLPAGGVLTGGGDPERITGRLVTASFFPTLGVKPQVGRFFNEEEDRPGGNRVIVLSQRLWQRRFAGNSEVIGKPIQLNGESWTVVGVMPGNFDYYGVANGNNDYFIPLGQISAQQYMTNRSTHPVQVTARMKPGVSLEQVQNEFQAIAARLATQYPDTNAGNSITARTFLDDYVGDLRRSLLTVFGAVGLLLLIACGNVANLLLARASGRRREIAIRLAMGASRWRIMRQLLTESLLLALSGGVLGLLIATWGVSLLLKLGSDALSRTEEIGLDLRVLLFTLFVTVATGVIFGLAPALQTSGIDIQQTLKGSASSISGGLRSLKLTSVFVVVELALSLVLLVGTGLLLRSFQQLLIVQPGFDANNVLTLRLRLPDAKYQTTTQTIGFLNNVLKATSALPGVTNVSVGTGFPMRAYGESDYQLEGEQQPQRSSDAPVAVSQAISASYYDTLGIPLLAGRHFTDHDTTESPLVVIVDDTFVRRHFSNASMGQVIGRRLRFGGDAEPWREIVGVVGHIRHSGLEEEGRAEIYRPWLQMNPKWMLSTTRAMDLIVKTSANPETFVGPIKQVVQSIDPDQPLANVITLGAVMDESIAPRRMTLSLLGLFAAVAFLLASIGLYGVMAYHVSQRIREIGIRLALGAQRANVWRLIVGQGLKLVLVAVTVGLVASWLLTRLIKSLLFVVSPTDPVAFLVPALLLTVIAVLACYIPARRATRVDPLVALRNE
jgi:putative ABC transport system permease protein